MQYFTEGWNRNKFSEDKFHDVYYHGLCSAVKDNYFTTEAKTKYCLDSLNECLLQLKDCYKPIFSETKEINKEEKDKEPRKTLKCDNFKIICTYNSLNPDVLQD